MMFGGYQYDGESFYDGYKTYLEEESFDEHYGDEIEDRVIPALDSDEVIIQQLTLLGGAY